MTKTDFYGAGFPYKDEPETYTGKLIVIEGTDGVGRSTQITLLREWLEKSGYACSNTGLRRSPLTAPGLEQAKTGNTLSPTTLSLFYATDFADRLENQIMPALKAGFIVLSDRYFYSIVARDVVRGLNRAWARGVYGFALKPDIVLYLKANVETLVSRIVHARGFNYWEAGMDLVKANNLYDSFITYQTSMLAEFDRMAEEFRFITIDANRSTREVFEDLRRHVHSLVIQK